jgi:F-type H+-transporting ATPase subunit b
VLTLNWNIFWVIFNIIILFILLRIFLYKPLQNIMQKRTELIQNEINSAETKNKEASALKEQYESSMKNAKAESDEIVGQAKERAKVQYDQIVGSANEEAAQIVSQAHKTAESDRDQMMRDAQSELADVALAAAAKLIGKNIDDEANRKMLDDFLSEEGSV